MKTVNTLENLYYGNIDPHEHTVSNGTDKGELLETVVRLETELRATLTEQQKALLEQFEKADAEISDRHELQAFTILLWMRKWRRWFKKSFPCALRDSVRR